jgi:hypothetical protein
VTQQQRFDAVRGFEVDRRDLLRAVGLKDLGWAVSAGFGMIIRVLFSVLYGRSGCCSRL